MWPPRPAEPGLLPLNAVVAMPDSWSDADAMAAAAQATDGVERAIIAYDDGNQGLAVVTADEARALGAVGVPDSPYVAIDLYPMLSGGMSSDGTREPAAAPAPAGADAVYVVALVNGGDGAVDRARTALEVAGHLSLAPDDPCRVPGCGHARHHIPTCDARLHRDGNCGGDLRAIAHRRDGRCGARPKANLRALASGGHVRR